MPLLSLALATASLLIGQAPSGRRGDDLNERIIIEHQLESLAGQSDAQRMEKAASREFRRNFNAHANAMNVIAEDVKASISNLKHFEEVVKSWKALFKDPGFLKRNKGDTE